MSNRLLRSLVDFVSPPTSLALNAPEFFPLFSGAWQQEDARGIRWGFLGVKLTLPEDPDTLQRFLTGIAQLPATAIKVGVYSRAQRGTLTRSWAAKHKAVGELAGALVKSRQRFLRHEVGLREHHGFLVLQRQLAPDSETPWAPLEELFGLVDAYARAACSRLSPMGPADLTYFNLGAVAPEYQSHVSDLPLDLTCESPLALQLALRELDASQFKGSYRAVLTLATRDPDYHPDYCNPRVRAHCVVRLRAEPEELRRANLVLMTALRKRGILGSPQPPVAQPMWPTVRMQSRWPAISTLTLNAYLGLATQLPGQSAHRGGVPLFTESGELRAFDPFMGSCGNNTIVAGSAGAGRHFLAKEVLTQHLMAPAGGAAWVVDESGYYTRMADALGGTVTDLKQAHGGLDAMAAVRTKDDLEDTAHLLLSWLAMLTDHGEEEDGVVRCLWEMAIWKCWEMTGRITLATFVATLQYLDHPRARSEAERFAPFLASGDFGRFFQGALAMPEGDFVVFQLHDYSALPYKDLGRVAQSIQVQVLIYWRRNRCRDMRRKLLVIDDTCPVASQHLLCSLMRRTRMLAGGLLLLGRLDDILAGGRLDEVAKHVNHLLIQRSSPEQVHRFANEYGFSESVRYELQKLRSLTDRLADVLLVSHEYGDCARFIFRVDALSYALYNSRPQNAFRYDELRNQGATPLEALNLCAENGPSIIR